MNTRNSIIRLSGPRVIISTAFVLAVIFLLSGRQTYKATEDATFEEFNHRQLILAKGVTAGIELYFKTLAESVKALGRTTGVQDIDQSASMKQVRRTFEFLKSFGVKILDAKTQGCFGTRQFKRY